MNVGKGETYLLLAGVKIGTTISETNMEAIQQTISRPT